MTNNAFRVATILFSVVAVIVCYVAFRYFDHVRAIAEAGQHLEAIRSRVDHSEQLVARFAVDFQAGNKSQDDFRRVLYPLAVEEDDFLWAEWLTPVVTKQGGQEFRVKYTSCEGETSQNVLRRLEGALANATDFEKYKVQLKTQSGVFLSKQLQLHGRPVFAAVRPIYSEHQEVNALAVGYFRSVLSHPTRPDSLACMQIFRKLPDGSEALVVSEGGKAHPGELLSADVTRGCEEYRVVFSETASLAKSSSTKSSMYGLLLGLIFLSALSLYYWRKIAEKFRSECNDLTDEVSERRETQRTLQSLLALRDSERRTVSSDIHDGFVQEAISAQMFLDALASRVDHTDPVAREHLANLKHSIEQAITEGRRMVSRHQVLAVDDYGFLPALQRLVLRQRENFGIHVSLRYPDNLPEIDIQQQRCIYRIVQESLTNVRRHSGATEASVQLYVDNKWFCVDVTDEGCGFDLDLDCDAPQSYGIKGMHERVLVLDGELEIKSAKGEGTVVSVRLPIEEDGNVFSPPHVNVNVGSNSI